MEDLFSPEFWALVQWAQKRGQRKGQAIFNVACEMFPETAGELWATAYDPFYDDQKIPEFLEQLVDLITK